MKVGITGFRGAGKTTAFKALTGLAQTPLHGRDGHVHVGMTKVPDARIDFLADVFGPRKVTYAELAFVDLPGFDGEKLAAIGADQHLRSADAVAHVVADFADPATGEDPATPLADLVKLQDEMVLSDLEQAESMLRRMIKERKGNVRQQERIQRFMDVLGAGDPLRTAELDEDDHKAVVAYGFLSGKPCIGLVNRRDVDCARPLGGELEAAAAERGMSIIAMAAEAEAEIAELDQPDQQEFLADIGLTAPAHDRFVAATYELLELISFLTMGSDECRAWTIKRGTMAQKAAGKVHSDIERGFIRAEVIAFEDFRQHPSEAECRKLAKMRLEGKEYVVQDGDIIDFRFHV